MNKVRIIGSWKEFGLLSSPKSLMDENLHPEKTFQTEQKILDYLESGHLSASSGTKVHCLFTNEEIGTPDIFHDGEIAWTSPYIFYLKKGRITVHEDLLRHIEAKNYCCPSKEEIGLEKRRAFATAFGEKTNLVYL